MKQNALAPLLALALSACATPQVNQDGASLIRIGQKAYIDGPRITVLKVLEDSRCPMEARCAWAGRVRLEVRIELGSGITYKELASDRTLQVADGYIELRDVMPPRSTSKSIAPRDYRFAIKFNGGY